MLAEARELYNYTVGNEPFRSQIEEIRDNHTDYVMAKIKIRSIVFSADLRRERLLFTWKVLLYYPGY